MVVVREGAEVTHPIYSQRCTRAQYCAIVLQPRTWRCAAGVIGITLLSAPHPRTAAAVQQGWAHLGKRQVDFRADHDIVRTAGEGRFKRIRIVVQGGDLEMFDVRLTFGDGKMFSPATRFYFKGSSRSRVIALPGAARVIRWIDFYYRSVPGGRQGNATVHVYGRR